MEEIFKLIVRKIKEITIIINLNASILQYFIYHNLNPFLITPFFYDNFLLAS